MPKKTTTVYPVDGRYLADVPAVAHECADPHCIESGAFSPDQPPVPTPDPVDAGHADPQEA